MYQKVDPNSAVIFWELYHLHPLCTYELVSGTERCRTQVAKNGFSPQDIWAHSLWQSEELRNRSRSAAPPNSDGAVKVPVHLTRTLWLFCYGWKRSVCDPLAATVTKAIPVSNQKLFQNDTFLSYLHKQKLHCGTPPPLPPKLRYSDMLKKLFDDIIYGENIFFCKRFTKLW